MAPIVDNTTAGSSSAATLLKEKHPEFSSLSSTAASAITVNNFGEEIIDEHDNDTMIHRIATTNNNNTTGSSLFLDECGNNDNNTHFIEDTMTHMDLHNTALMTSFDDIDLLSTASPRPEHLQQPSHQFQQDTLTNMQLIISNDEELARQLQAEEDELAHRQREIFRKKQSRSGPTRKLKKSWLDNLIGEPFPQEMRSNYTKKTVGSDKKKRGGGGSNGTSSGLMRAIAAKEARAAAKKKKKNSTVILSDRTNKIGCSKGLDRKENSVDESVSQLSTSISNWWSNKVDNNNNNNNTNTRNNDPPTFIDQGSGEGYYQGDYLTTPQNQQPIQPLQRHGQGTMTYKSGHSYTGNFHNNTLHGWGIYHWADGDRQRGTWRNGLRHGPCIFHHGVSHCVEYGYYNMGRVVGEGVRLDAARTTAWKLVDGRRVGDTIGIEEAERIVEERFSCFPIPAAVRVKEEC